MSDTIEPKSTAKAEPAKARSGNGAATSSTAAVDTPSTPIAQQAAVREADEGRNLLVPKGAWPPPIYIQSLASEEEKWFMEHRWHAQWDWYDKKATYFKKRHLRIQLVIGVSAAIVPALVAINSPDVAVSYILKAFTIVLSLIVTSFTIWENVYKHGDMWRSFRAAAEELAREKSLYDMHAGPYKKAKQPYNRFVERTEEIIAKQNGQWLNAQMAPEEEKTDKGDKSTKSVDAETG